MTRSGRIYRTWRWLRDGTLSPEAWARVDADVRAYLIADGLWEFWRTVSCGATFSQLRDLAGLIDKLVVDQIGDEHEAGYRRGKAETIEWCRQVVEELLCAPTGDTSAEILERYRRRKNAVSLLWPADPDLAKRPVLE